jgi:hypothetical protein
MCGRTVLSMTLGAIQSETRTEKWAKSEKYKPSYNVTIEKRFINLID